MWHLWIGARRGLGTVVDFVVLVDVTGVMLFEHVAPLDRCLPRGWG